MSRGIVCEDCTGEMLEENCLSECLGWAGRNACEMSGWMTGGIVKVNVWGVQERMSMKCLCEWLGELFGESTKQNKATLCVCVLCCLFSILPHELCDASYQATSARLTHVACNTWTHVLSHRPNQIIIHQSRSVILPTNNTLFILYSSNIQNTPCLNKNCATVHSFISLRNVDQFSKFFAVVFSVKFATNSMSYISPQFKGVTLLPCKTQKTETSKILLHVMQ